MPFTVNERGGSGSITSGPSRRAWKLMGARTWSSGADGVTVTRAIRPITPSEAATVKNGMTASTLLTITSVSSWMSGRPGMPGGTVRTTCPEVGAWSSAEAMKRPVTATLRAAVMSSAAPPVATDHSVRAAWGSSLDGSSSIPQVTGAGVRAMQLPPTQAAPLPHGSSDWHSGAEPVFLPHAAAASAVMATRARARALAASWGIAPSRSSSRSPRSGQARPDRA